jgi:hypothetical protein
VADLTPEQRDAVLEKVAERRRIAAGLAERLPQESALDLVRRRNDERRARRAEDAGQLDFGGE